MKICQVTSNEEKQRITRQVLEALPEWFGIPEARENYISESRDQLFFCAYAAEKPAAGAYSIFCEDGSDDPTVTAQIQARYDAKKAKNFAEADRIRDELKAQGIEITDIPGGAKWKHI